VAVLITSERWFAGKADITHSSQLPGISAVGVTSGRLPPLRDSIVVPVMITGCSSMV
jgi:hypothetical protein